MYVFQESHSFKKESIFCSPYIHNRHQISQKSIHHLAHCLEEEQKGASQSKYIQSMCV